MHVPLDRFYMSKMLICRILYRVFFLFVFAGFTALAFAQPVYVQQSPFRVATMGVQYTDSTSNFSGQVFIENYGERVVADYKGVYENKTFERRIMRKDQFLYFFNHNRQVITKIPVNPALAPFARTGMVKICDTIFLSYNCDFCTPMDDSLKSVTAIFFNNLLLKLDKSGGGSYKVTNVDESLNSGNVFATPRDYLIKEMNYNFDF